MSARHVHLSQEHLEILFGKGHELTVKKMLMGDQFAAEECVTLVSPSLRTIEGVRVLGPVRKQSQVEIVVHSFFLLKIEVSFPIAVTGKLKFPVSHVGIGLNVHTSPYVFLHKNFYLLNQTAGKIFSTSLCGRGIT